MNLPVIIAAKTCTLLAPCAILFARLDMKLDILEKTVKHLYSPMQYCSCPGVHRGDGSNSALYERKVCELRVGCVWDARG